jgi:fructokinase
VRALPSHALRIFDVNLRQNYFSREILRESLKLSDVAKLSHEELPAVAELLGLPAAGDEPSARQLVEKFSLKLVCITRGKHGSLLVTEKESAEHPGFQVTVADTVGAGDAFTACLTHHYLRDCTLAGINEQANRFAAWVASCPGGTPSLAGRELSEVLKLIGQNKSAPANPARADSQI